MNISIIGGGAAGFFAAITAKYNFPDADVSIIEKTQKLLSKVRISGGGRCNVTNGCTSVLELCEGYPRGGRKLKKLFSQFNTIHIKEWFESRGVPLKTEDDNRVFPVSDDSQSIIDCLLNETRTLGIKIILGTSVKSILEKEGKLELSYQGDRKQPELFDKVIVASGGSPKRSGLEWLEELGHKIEEPVPSLFTFNMPGEPITKLMGVSVPNAIVKIQGMKLKSEGPLLITHWGMSGPAILKLSAFGARSLSEVGYHFGVQVSWIGELNTSIVAAEIEKLASVHSKKYLANVKPYALPERLWVYLLDKCNLSKEMVWGQLGTKSINKLVNVLCSDIYSIKGKTTFKEEFVTCGGISLESVDLNTMKSKEVDNLYFAGEILDIDGVTGGYNFQAAWTTAFIAGKLG